MWSTLNEPWVVTDGGYLHGALAPGHRNLFEAPIASHNLLLAARRGRRGLPRRGEAPDRPGGEPRAEVPGLGQPGGSRRHPPGRRLHEPPVSRSGVPRRAIRRRCGRSSARPGRTSPPRTSRASASRSISSASTTTRAACRSSIATALPGAGERRAAEAPRLHGDALGGLSAEGLTDTLVWVKERYGDIPALHHRERRGLLRSARGSPAGAEVQDPLRVDYLRSHLRAVTRGDRPRRRSARLLRLVAARQPRVEPRLREALRHRARGLRDAEADAEGERAVLQRGDPDERGDVGVVVCYSRMAGVL